MPRRLDADAAGIEEAAARLRDGEVVAFPTETVYGLGALTHDATALQAIFTLKRRPLDNPLIAHVVDGEAAAGLTTLWPASCDALAETFWPGALTLVLPRRADVPDEATAGRETIAVRAPRHPTARALLDAVGAAISAPSANRSGHVSPTTAAHVAADFPEADDLVILDAGPCTIGLESTVLDIMCDPPCILRPGSVTQTELEGVLGPVAVREGGGQAHSPGTAVRHYAPRIPVSIVETDDLPHRLPRIMSPCAVLCFEAESVPAPHRPIVMPQGAGDYARRLYDALRQAESMDVVQIVIESVPASNDMWRAIDDRLRRATASEV